MTFMIRTQLLAVAITAALAAASPADQELAQLSNPEIPGLVKVADAIKLPAKEPGVLVQLTVQEGAQVRAGQVIAKIDDSEPVMQKKAANAAYAAAYKRWEDDIEIRYQVAAAAAAKADFEQLTAANKINDRTVPEIELLFKKLEWDKASLGGDKSKHERIIAGYEANVKKVEVEAADLAIQRRVVTAPFDGVVEEVKRHQDEWVQPGDTILTLLRMDTLHVEGAVEQSKYDPHEVQGCEVTVDVMMARGRKASFRGRIIKVSSVVRGDGVYDVRAEITNRQEHGNWLLRDGLDATMTIHLGTGGKAPAVSRSR
jgi:multidrug efflux pump subunit AcrA (membrane-fusion protein)